MIALHRPNKQKIPNSWQSLNLSSVKVMLYLIFILFVIFNDSIIGIYIQLQVTYHLFLPSDNSVISIHRYQSWANSNKLEAILERLEMLLQIPTYLEWNILLYQCLTSLFNLQKLQ